MPPAKLPDDKIQEAVRLRRQGLTLREIGRRLGCHCTTVRHYVNEYVPHGAPPTTFEVGRAVDRTDVDGSVEMIRMDRPPTVQEMMKACDLDPKVWVPQYFCGNAWQGFAKMKVADGEEIRKVPLYQSKLTCKRIIAEELEAALLEFVRENVAAIPAPRKSKIQSDEGQMLAWGLWDAHIGMYAWNSEVGSSFDVAIARNRVLNSVDDLVVELRPYKICRVVMPVGNDAFHFDSVRHTTAFGEHFLDTDTRFAKVFQVALECQSYMVERALEVAARVEVLYVPGNHDTTSSYCLCAALQQRYRNDPRVQVDLGPNPRKYVSHGGVLLGFDHGAEKDARQLAQIFATEARDLWSASTYREIQIGHTHQRREQNFAGAIPTNGVTVRTNPALCANDFWHHKQGLIGEPVKSVEAWRYDKVGYRGSHVAWARDDERSLR